ncbi:MAG: serine hydrolase [Anaerolineae bacterium]
MLRVLAVLFAIIALILVASYNPLLAAAPNDDDTPGVTRTEPTPVAPGLPPQGQASRALWRELPLEALSPDAVEYIGQRAGSVGVAVIVPEYHTIYTTNGHERFHLASVAKVLIMLTLLDKAAAAGRDLTAEETAHLEPMIVLSSNDDADALWSTVGGADAVKSYLAAHALRETAPDEDGFWGETEASPEDVAQLLAGLIENEGIDEAYRSVAVDLMLKAVDWSGGWGAVSGIPDDPSVKVYSGAKDGWYSADEGWWVNSAGFVLPDHAKPPYALAILTNGQPSVEYGAQTVHDIAAQIHQQMLAQR